MITKNNKQIQIRIDAKTKTEANKVLNNLGMDMSSAVKLFLRQMIKVGNLPFELRGENGLTLYNTEILRESIISAKNSNKTFKDGASLIKEALKD